MQRVFRNCVSGVIVSSDGKILLGRKNPRAGGVWADCWHLPGGGVEQNESHHQALRREVLEETGINISSMVIDMLDADGRGEAEKRDRHTGETVLAVMNFFVYKVQLPFMASQVRLDPQSDLAELAWVSVHDLTQYKLTPPSVMLFVKMGWL
jgi:8-oxo-dGTP pyrophosphatase MutT (NUDIX family)